MNINKRKINKICFVVHAYYPADETRVKRDAELLARNGFKVDVICLRDNKEVKNDLIEGVNVIRLNVKRHRNSPAFVYLLEYIMFLILALFRLTSNHINEKYSIVQFNTPPDFLVFAGLFIKILGAKIILDMHETLPDLYLDRMGLSQPNIFVKIIIFFERISISFSHVIITVSEPVKSIIESRIKNKNIYVIMNVADEKIFARRNQNEKNNNDKKILMVYHGMVTKSYNLIPVLETIAYLKLESNILKNFKFEIYGTGIMFNEIKDKIISLGIADIVHLMGFLQMEDVAKKIMDADIGIVPVSNTYYSKFALPTKLLEYANLGIPTLVPKFETINYYFNQDMVCYYNLNIRNDLTNKLKEVISNINLREKMIYNLQTFSNTFSWAQQGDQYLKIIRELI